MAQPKGKPSNNKKKSQKKHTLSWFEKRIGKIIYRKDCGVFGVEVKSMTHARALDMYQNDLDLYYADKPFEK